MAREVDIIKEKLDLVDFLKGYVNLVPAGRNFKAICPFHQEKTPSFIVSPEKKIWHCFGCGKGGDLIGFVMEYEHLEFPEALKFLSERAGIPLQTASYQQQKQFGVLFDLHEAARDFFVNELRKNPAAEAYLKERGVAPEIVQEFGIGFSPGGEALTLHLLEKGYDINDIARAGLTHKNIRGLYRDRFHSRIMFPIENHIGKIVAFSGRLFQEESSPHETANAPKYLNSPETPIFNKSKVLYGFNRAKRRIADTKTVFLVEGQMDFLLSWQNGIENTVAVSGTGLTREHLRRLRRIADTAVVSFDNDEAGIRALERSLELFHAEDFHVKAADLGAYKDPADAFRLDAERAREAVQNARPAFIHLFEWYFSPSRIKERDIPEQKRLMKELLRRIASVKSPIEQDAWLKELSRYSGVSETSLRAAFAEIPDRGESAGELETAERAPRDRMRAIVERLLTLAFTDKMFLSEMKARRDLFPEEYRSVIDGSHASAAAFFEMKASYEEGRQNKEERAKEFGDLLRHLEIEHSKANHAQLMNELQRAEAAGNEDKAVRILREIQETAARIQELGNGNGA